jgi:hypothetical protein
MWLPQAYWKIHRSVIKLLPPVDYCFTWLAQNLLRLTNDGLRIG